MDADEFINAGAIPKRQSKLAPYLADLLKLRAANLSLDQMVEFLAMNGVTVTRATVSKFLAAPRPDAGKAVPAPASRRAAARATSESIPTPGAKALAPFVEDLKSLPAQERQAAIEKQTAKFFPNRFAKTSDE